MRRIQSQSDRVSQLEFALDGQSLLTLSETRQPPVRFPDPAELQELFSLLSITPREPITAESARPADQPAVERPEYYLYTTVARYDLRTNLETARWRLSGSTAAVLSPDQSRVWHSVSVAVTGWECDLRTRVLSTNEETVVLQTDDHYVSRLACSPDGRLLALGGMDYCGDHKDYVWRLNTRDGSLRSPIQTDVLCLQYSPDGRFLATGHPKGGVNLWRDADLFRHFTEPANQLVWSPDGSLAWAADGAVHIARTDDAGPCHSLSCPGDVFNVLRFSRSGDMLLAGTRAGLVRIFDRRGDAVRSFDWVIGPVHSLACARDGLTAAAGGERGQVVVWDLDG